MISEKEKFFDPRKPFASKRPETHEEWQARMGGEVLAVVRSGLYLDFRFLDMALSALTPVPGLPRAMFSFRFMARNFLYCSFSFAFSAVSSSRFISR